MRVMTAASLKIENFEPKFSKTISTTKLNSLKRCIDFGTSLDVDREMRWIEDKLKEQEEITSKLWNFNFRKGTTLDPEGTFHWISLESNRECDEIDDEFNFQPIDPVNITTTISSPSSSSKKNLIQKSITDFMPSTKNRQMNKDITSPSSERPFKIRKLGDCSS